MIEQLIAICPNVPPAKLERFAGHLTDAMGEFGIDSTARIAPFIANVAEESMSFQHVRELADGKAYDPPAHVAVRLGNTEVGDGPRYKGRGLLQITGKKNYRLCGAALGLDLLSQPDLLEEPANACRSAGWFWAIGAGLNLGSAAHAHGLADGCNLNVLADDGDFLGIVLAINGGTNGLDKREAFFERARQAFA